MNSHHLLLGLYVPGDSFWHRCGVWWKYFVVLACTAPALLLQLPIVTAVSLVLSAGVLLTTGLPRRVSWQTPRALTVFLAVVVVFQAFLGQFSQGVVVAGNLLAAVYAARLITLTTPPSALIDSLVSAARLIPGVDAERFGLAVAIMLRSIPFLFGTFADVRDSARARGLERNFFARLTPVVIRAVAFAEATGDALDARGLGGRGPRMTG